MVRTRYQEIACRTPLTEIRLYPPARPCLTDAASLAPCPIRLPTPLAEHAETSLPPHTSERPSRPLSALPVIATSWRLACACMFAAVGAMQATGAMADPVTINILRQHSGRDCVSGQLAINGNVVAYTVERPYEGNLPLISSIPNGRYSAFVRGIGENRWRIELKDVPGQRTNIQLHVGNFVPDSLGCILVGRTISGDLCSLIDSIQGFDRFKIEFARAAGGQPDKDVHVTVQISDR